MSPTEPETIVRLRGLAAGAATLLRNVRELPQFGDRRNREAGIELAYHLARAHELSRRLLEQITPPPAPGGDNA